MLSARFWRDPVFLAAACLYGLNNLYLAWVGTHAGWFWRGYFNDCLLVPAALPVLVAAETLLGLRRPGHPRWYEIAAYLAVWIPLFEWLLPSCFPGGTADPLDIAAYVAGGVVAALLWSGLAIPPKHRYLLTPIRGHRSLTSHPAQSGRAALQRLRP